MEKTDFKLYDIEADGKLHRTEMSAAKLRCFLQQLIRTSDRDVLKHFTDAIQNDLWEAIKKALPKVAKGRKIPPQVKKLIKTLLKYDFSSDAVKGRAQVQYDIEYYSSQDRMPGFVLKEASILHKLTGKGVLKINIPMKGWRLRSHTELLGSYNRAENVRRMIVEGDETKIDVKEDYPGINASTMLLLMKRNSRFKVKLDAGLEKYWNPLPDLVTSKTNIGGSLTLRQPYKSKFALTASATWSNKEYSEPQDAVYNRQQEASVTAGVETSYLFKKAGAVLRYNYTDSDKITSFLDQKQKKHLPSLLAHVVLKKGYLRMGGGGGFWHSGLKLLGESTATKAEGGEVHGYLEAQFRPRKWLYAKAVLFGAANYSKGDFNGWFPSWTAEGSVMFSVKKLFAILAVGWSGHYRNLENEQIFNYAYILPKVFYRPTSTIHIGLAGLFSLSKQTKHQSYDSRMWIVNPTVACRLLKKSDMWLNMGVMYAGNSYDQTDYSRRAHNVGGSVNVKARF